MKYICPLFRKALPGKAIFNRALMSLIVSLGTVSMPASAQAPQLRPYMPQPGTASYIRAAIESPARTEQQRERDGNRKPAEMLTMSGVKPGDRVVEFAAFGQYYTTMLTEIVGEDGEVYMFDLPYTAERSEEPSRAFVASRPNVHYQLVDYNEMSLPADVDVVFNILYYHDLSLNNIDTDVLNRKIYDALRPGGTFFIIDHNAEPGSGTRDTESLHRIDPEVIKQEVTAAGFVLVEESNLLGRADDDHTGMVFTPGVRGATDRAVLKFRKPGRGR